MHLYYVTFEIFDLLGSSTSRNKTPLLSKDLHPPLVQNANMSSFTHLRFRTGACCFIWSGNFWYVSPAQVVAFELISSGSMNGNRLTQGFYDLAKAQRNNMVKQRTSQNAAFGIQPIRFTDFLLWHQSLDKLPSQVRSFDFKTRAHVMASKIVFLISTTFRSLFEHFTPCSSWDLQINV